MIFVDTSALFALASDRDLKHREARLAFDRLLQAERRLLTHSYVLNYVLSESMALLHQRLGRGAALALAAETRAFDIESVDEPLHRAAVDALHGAPRGVSLVDQVSFLVMRRRGIDESFAFDRHFAVAGGELLPYGQTVDEVSTMADQIARPWIAFPDLIRAMVVGEKSIW